MWWQRCGLMKQIKDLRLDQICHSSNESKNPLCLYGPAGKFLLIPIILGSAVIRWNVAVAQEGPKRQARPLSPVLAPSPDASKLTPQQTAVGKSPRVNPRSVPIAQDEVKTRTGVEAVKVEQIVVTAEKRPENVQHVPIAISVLGPKNLAEVSPISPNADIARRTPNFTYLESGGQYANSGNIRGVGSFSPLSPNDTSITYNIDEIPQSAYGIQPSTLDMERVEVLRGPQGTLYGLNTQGGAINYISNRPFFGHELTVGAEYGSKDWRTAQLTANETLIDGVLAGRLALRYNGRNGNYGNSVLGGRDGESNIGAARGSLLFTPDTRTKVLFSFNYNRSEDSMPRFVLKGAPCFPCDGLDQRPVFNREDYGGNLRIEHDFDDFRFVSLSSGQQNNFHQKLDLTDSLIFGKLLGVSGSLLNNPNRDIYTGNIDETRYYQEFRFLSPDSSKIKWTAGLNFFRSDTTVATNGSKFTVPNFSVFSGQQNNRVTLNSYAAFVDGSVPIIGGLRALGGVRLTHFDEDASYRYIGGGLPGTVATFNQNSSFSDTFLTGRMGLSYDWSPNFMIYATAGRGAVGGGYAWNGSNIPSGRPEPSFPTSMSWSYEGGFKSTLLGGRATLNGAVFYNTIKNGHLYVLNRSLLTYQTAALDFDTYGGELEGRVKVTRAFSLQGDIGYTHAELKNVPNNSLTGAKSGNTVPNVPTITASVGGEYRTDAALIGIRHGTVYLSASYQFVDKRAADVTNDFNLHSYGIANARIGWDCDFVKVYVFANNMSNKRYEAVGASYGRGVEAVTVGLGRTVGVGASLKL